MATEERENRMRQFVAQHERIIANGGRRLLAPAPAVMAARVARAPARLGRAVGWDLPNWLRLFAWGASGKRAEGGVEIDSSFRGFIGRPGGYDDAVGRAVAGGLLSGLAVLWECACGEALPLRWVGARPEAEYWFVFGGTAADLDELFRRARRFAGEYPGADSRVTGPDGASR